MILDKQLAGILSNFCLDIAKAYFVATFVTPSLSGTSIWWELLLILTKGLVFVILLIVLSWQLAKLGETK